MQGFRRGTRLFLSVALLAASLVGCAKDEEECGGGRIAEDQKGSLMAPLDLSQLPVEVVIDAQFDSDAVKQIQLAMFEWNRVGRGLMGSDFFRMTRAFVPSGVRAATANGCSQDFGGEGRFYIVQETSISNPGLTVRCSVGDQVTSQVVFLNLQLIPSGQMLSVALHELGHAVGLDHSCSTSNPSSNFRACAGLSSGHPYHVAVMYPQLSSGGSGGPEKKEYLQENDISRAQCHYNRNQ